MKEIIELFNINNKLNRLDFLFMLFMSFACGVVSGSSFCLNLYILDLGGCFFMAFGLFLCLISNIHRLNDIGWNRWLFLLNFVPYVNILFFIVILFSRGRE